MMGIHSSLVILILVLLPACCVQAQDPHDTLYITPKPSGPVVFLETFNTDHWTSIFKPSKDPKYLGDWKVEESDYLRVSGDRGLIVGSAASHHAIGALFPTPLDNTGKDLVVQYEVQLQHGLDCGGAYIKLLTASPSLDISAVDNNVPYTIMFGPDKCGFQSKLHFIVRHENPINHTIEEKHLDPQPEIKVDKLTHLYTLHVHEDNTFDIYIDQVLIKSGDLLRSMVPPINPQLEIDDPADIKPADWVDEEFIPDPESSKPDDWDESEPAKIPDPKAEKPEDWVDDAPETIPDPSVAKPVDWDDEEDGEWTAPYIDNPVCIEHGCGEWTPNLIKNPKYKGKWVRPNVKNPIYKGVWKPRQIPNPHYFEDLHPSNFPKMAGIAFELWTMTDGILFDNILITHDKSVADDFASRTWAPKYSAEKEKSDAEAVSNEPGFLETAQEYLAFAYHTAVENPLAVGAAIVAGLVPIFVCTAMSIPKKTRAVAVEPVAQPSNKTTKVAKEEQVEEIQEEEEDESTKKSPSVRKRRVPRA